MPSDSTSRTPEEAQRLAEKILLFSRRYISQLSPLMLTPIYALRQEPVPLPAPMATDGVHLFYSPEKVIADFQKDRNAPARQLLHTTLHCLLGHLQERPGGEGVKLFDAAADLKVSQFARALSPVLCSTGKAELNSYTAPLPVLCRHGGEHPDAAADLIRSVKRMNLRLDNHSLWSLDPRRNGKAGEGRNAGDSGNSQKLPGEGAAPGENQGDAPDWKGMLQDLDRQARYGSAWGSVAGFLRAELDPTPENQISYSDFLRRFAFPNERLLLDPDSFDARWYCLGLELYGDIPLLEPSELSEPPLPDDIVLAMDTSGSCSGEVCSRFLRETLSLLRDISAGASRFRVLALQCDAQIQNELLLESSDQLNGFIGDFTPSGFGGTDFCPVFERVEELRRDGTLPRVRGLLYLSDGFGDFPDKAPDYPVTFLLLRESYGFEPCIPDWVNALILDGDDFTLKEAKE